MIFERNICTLTRRGLCTKCTKQGVSKPVFIYTDERNEIKASLRFKQNWHSDYNRPSTTKYKIFAAEVEKGVNPSNRIYHLRVFYNFNTL